MTIRELREQLPLYRDNIEVIVEDGSDPSDPCIATELELRKSEDGKTYLKISSGEGNRVDLKVR